MNWRFGAFIGLAVMSGLEAGEFTHERLFAEARTDPEWADANALHQIELIRDKALAHETSSDPVSDRYSLTFYGGPIDWVHF